MVVAARRQAAVEGGRRQRQRRSPATSPYDSYPLLRQGSKGDLVAWAQQLLAGGGYSTPITRLLRGADALGGARLPGARGCCPRPATIDVPTWNVLLRTTPLRGALDQERRGRGRRRRQRAARAALGPLPARRNEIPPAHARRSVAPVGCRAREDRSRACWRCVVDRGRRRGRLVLGAVGGRRPDRSTPTSPSCSAPTTRAAPAASSPGVAARLAAREPTTRSSSCATSAGRRPGSAGRRAPTATSRAAGAT